MYKYFKILLLFIAVSMNAQIHEIGVFAGGSNYIGDVGPTTYISPNKLALGLVYKYNRNPRLAYRFSLNTASIYANDEDSEEVSRNLRGYRVKNSIKEASLGIEFNFFDFNLHDTQSKLTPYVHSGINFFSTKDSYLSAGEIENRVKNLNGFAVPITLGIKSNILPHFILALEVGARYTLTDNLDGSNPKDDNLLKFGNINNNDWYVFSGMTLTYTFGNRPCYCTD